MPFDPRAVANRLLELARERQLSLDPMKVQKLLYYAHGWHLALTGKPLDPKIFIGNGSTKPPISVWNSWSFQCSRWTLLLAVACLEGNLSGCGKPYQDAVCDIQFMGPSP